MSEKTIKVSLDTSDRNRIEIGSAGDFREALGLVNDDIATRYPRFSDCYRRFFHNGDDVVVDFGSYHDFYKIGIGVDKWSDDSWRRNAFGSADKDGDHVDCEVPRNKEAMKEQKAVR